MATGRLQFLSKYKSEISMTRMEEENTKLRALLQQIKRDLGPALTVLADDLRAYDQRWYTNLAYIHYRTTEELINESRRSS